MILLNSFVKILTEFGSPNFSMSAVNWSSPGLSISSFDLMLSPLRPPIQVVHHRHLHSSLLLSPIWSVSVVEVLVEFLNDVSDFRFVGDFCAIICS